MKKFLNLFFGLWAITLILFNLSVIIFPAPVGDFNQYKTGTIIYLILYNLVFVAQLIFAFSAFKEKELPKLYKYRKQIPEPDYDLIAAQYIGVIATMLIGIIFMIIHSLPAYAGLIGATVFMLCIEVYSFKDTALVKKIVCKKVVAVLIASVLVITAGVLASVFVVIPSIRYNNACKLENAGDDKGAVKAFAQISGYKDSNEHINNLLNKDSYLKYYSAKIGETVYLGSYEQDNNLENGKEPIEWIVLDRYKDKVLLIAKDALDSKKYNEELTSVTWETCTLRKWLNEDFYNEAFSDADKAIIADTKLNNHDSTAYRKSYGGNNTVDKVFPLSYNEANYYLPTHEFSLAKATLYAKEQGSYVNAGSGLCWWWLRSPGAANNHAARANINDTVERFSVMGLQVSQANYSVRPSVWIEVK